MKDHESPQESLSVGRRGFFRQILLRGIEQAQQVAQSVGDQTADMLETMAGPQDGPKRYLRPPGALTEENFAQTCSQCGDCVTACPADAIKIEPNTAGGLPHIIARTAPCVICDDLACMTACPTGALEPLPVRTLIEMGTAVMDFDRCLRSLTGDQIEGEDCRICITQCPIGETAIGMDDQQRVQVREGCTGCGVCEHLCPTNPPSIVIEPR